MNLTTVCLLAVLFVALITPIRNLIQITNETMIEFVKKTARKWQYKRHQAKISAILYEVTHIVSKSAYSLSRHVGVAKEIASPAPSLTKGWKYTGDTLFFIVCDNSSSPTSFVSENHAFLVWEKDGKAFFYSRKKGTVLLDSKNSRQLMSLLAITHAIAKQSLKFHLRAKSENMKNIESEVA